MRILILAAGYGTRLSAHTRKIPKALLPVNTRPLLSYIISKIDAVRPCADIAEVVVMTNEMYYRQFLSWKERYAASGVRIVSDGTRSADERLGAVGDLHLALSGCRDDWLVLGSDNFFDWQLDGFLAFAREKAPSPVVGLYDVKKKNVASQMGVVSRAAAGTLTALDEKPEHPEGTLVATCIYFFPAETVDSLGQYVCEPGRPDMLGHYINWLCARRDVYGYQFRGYWKDIGTERSYGEVRARAEKEGHNE